MGISRRNLLKGAGALGLAVGSGLAIPAARRVLAQENAAPTPSAFYQLSLGEAQVTIIQDNAVPFNPDLFGSNQPEGAVLEFLEANNLSVEGLKNTFNILLLTNGDRRTLIDTGLSAANGGGRLIPTLAALGIAPEDITDVVISHFHGDHVNGISAEDGTLYFPNAAHYISQAEWDFLQSGPTDTVAGALAKLQPVVDADQLQYYNNEDEVVPGIQALATPGHTPGHHSFLIASGESQLLHLVDAATQNLISVQNPTWYFNFDADPEQAVETRIGLFNRAADEQIPVFGYHFAFPGIGYIAREGESFRYLATS